MKLVFLVGVLTICGCKGLGPFITDVGSASQGVEVGGQGSDTPGEQFVDAVELARPALPPVIGWILSGLLSGAAVYSHLKKETNEINN